MCLRELLAGGGCVVCPIATLGEWWSQGGSRPVSRSTRRNSGAWGAEGPWPAPPARSPSRTSLPRPSSTWIAVSLSDTPNAAWCAMAPSPGWRGQPVRPPRAPQFGSTACRAAISACGAHPRPPRRFPVRPASAGAAHSAADKLSSPPPPATASSSKPDYDVGSQFELGWVHRGLAASEISECNLFLAPEDRISFHDNERLFGDAVFGVEVTDTPKQSAA